MVDHHFGGAHTDDKLDRLRAYLTAFSIALKDQGFVRVYIDAFAGSGGRAEVLPALPLFGDKHAEPQVVSVPGSARIALDVDPPFDVLVLIEADRERHAALEALKRLYPSRKIECHQGEANDAVRRLCTRLPWRGSSAIPKGMRGVLFLDPYGMEVEWSTVEAVAKTRSIDVWYFFPLMGLYRQAPREIIALTADKAERLTRTLGTDEWRKAWYGTPNGPTTLFDDPATAVRTADVNAIEAFIGDRLKAIFKGAVLSPMRIYNGRGHPIASLFFAVSNPNSNAVKLATRIVT
ncbi:three-Cys-motif partner protein TcmP [Ancylobacter sp.]|uniref:three-Cys-motif partner protein TcmP n=1 Tax=Ancylobacter sp. TaxID=1872567 RepID=UPI003D129D5A